MSEIGEVTIKVKLDMTEFYEQMEAIKTAFRWLDQKYPPRMVLGPGPYVGPVPMPPRPQEF